jgi:DNA invertase Pin-like site-specific DNA recombinase
MSEKVKTQHLERKALLYVRQSSLSQVMRNEESRRLQYAMEQRLKELGWSQIEIVDEDLGCSAAGTTQRNGFERMVAEVCLGRVGAVAAREVSRFARNSREWQQLVEVCRMVDTLLVDHETVYDPRQGNDRLFLGLKGSLNEYELDLLRLRSVEASREKARRGELYRSIPVGFVKTPDQQVVKDPDRRVQEAIVRVFRKFLELGSARQTTLWLIEQCMELPCRCHGPEGWEIVWKRPSYHSVARMLTNYAYCGAYAYGKTTVRVEFRDGVARKRYLRKPVENWTALIYDHHDAYVSREDFERIQEMLARNSVGGNGPGPGAARRGPALLTGLLRCRRCGRKLTVAYTGRVHSALRYVCFRGALDHAEPRCISCGGSPIDEAVCREVLKVVQPGAIKAAINAAEAAVACQSEALQALQMDLEAARYAAERARKQFDAVDPENRLVVDELERRWNLALKKVLELEERAQREESRIEDKQPPGPEHFLELAANLDRVWNDPATDARLKKRILRALIEEVAIDVEKERGRTLLTIHWKGGVHTELRVRSRRRGENSRHTSAKTVEAVRALIRTCSDDFIAGVLNRNGLRTGRGNRWTRERVASLRKTRGIQRHSLAKQQEEGWMNLTQAAAHLRLSPGALRHAAERGEIEASHPLPDGPWIFKRADLDGPKGQRVAARRRQGPAAHRPDQLTLFDSTT